jgi:hypothetical protein
LAISSLLGFQGSRFFPLHEGSGVAEFRAQHAKIADDDEIMIGMLKNDPDRAGGNTLAAVGAFVLVYNISAGSDVADRSFRADFLTFPALRANIGPVFPGVGEFGLNPEGRLLGVDFAEMLDRADLETEAASRAFVPVDFDPHDHLLSPPSGQGSRE